MNLKEELAKAKEESTLAQGLWKQSPHYIAAVANVDIIAKREREKYQPEVIAAQKKYNDLYAQFHEHEKQPDLPEDIKEFFKDIRVGVDYGAVDFRLRWQSSDKRFIIFTIPGHMYWANMLSGQQYSTTSHYLIDLDAYKVEREQHLRRGGGHTLLGASQLSSLEGRLKPFNKDAWILETVVLSKVPYAPTKDKDS